MMSRTKAPEPENHSLPSSTVQNFDQGRFNYHQIQFVVDALIKLKENPLVVLPYKYGFDSFKINTGFAGELQRLTNEEIEIRDG